MNSEYVRISDTESVYGQRELLKSQLDFLSIINHIKRYKSIRNEEIAIKILLRTKIEEAKTSLQVLDKILPKPTIKEEDESFPEAKIEKERSTLEEEIEEIRSKLSKLV